MERSTRLYFPRWSIILYGLLSVGLIPWIFNLAENLPTRHLVRHWDAMWVGFDVLMLIAVLVTLWFLIRGLVWVTISASVLATLFIVDAWFDIMTAHPGKEMRNSILFGALEILLAILTYRLVFYVIHRSTPDKNISLSIGKQ